VTRYLLDTGIASDLINRRGLVPQRVRAARLRDDRVGLGTPVLGELIAGIQNSCTYSAPFRDCEAVTFPVSFVS
jgi:predicted nucleic acid-binding protein